MSHKGEKKKAKSKAKAKDKSKDKAKDKSKDKSKAKAERKRAKEEHRREKELQEVTAYGVYDEEMDVAEVRLVLKRLRRDGEPTGRVLVELVYSESDPRGAHRVLLGAIERRGYLDWATDLPEFPEAISESSPHEALEVLLHHKSGKLAGAMVGTIAGLRLEVIP